MHADFTMGRARHRHVLIHLFLLLFLGHTAAQRPEIFYSNTLGGNFSRPFDNITLDIFTPATGLAPNGSALCLTQPVDNVNPNDTSSQSEAAGRGLYKTPVQVRDPATKIVKSFSTMFSFWIDHTSLYDAGHGFAFVWAPDNVSVGSPGKYLGWLNESTEGVNLGNFAVEFDTVQNVEFDDPDRDHIGVNVNTLRSLPDCMSKQFGYYNAGEFQSLNMTTDAEARVYAWINYDSSKNELIVTVSPIKAKPEVPILTCAVNLSDYILFDDMYVGFTASTGLDSAGPHLSQHTVYEWSFGNDDFPPVNLFGNATISNRPLQPSEREEKVPVLPIAIAVPCGVFLLAGLIGVPIVLWRRKQAEQSRRFQDSELETLDSVRGPEKFSYKQLSAATNSFSKDACIGEGSFGSVYKGVSPKHSEVLAVKRISRTSKQGAQEFAAEVKVIGRVQHRNLVPLLGWCHDVSRGELLLVYEFMPNGSLDRLLFKHETDSEVLAWDKRVKILCGVGTALAFLHEEWKHRVVHRDVKASNVMLDAEFNARLGDFGLARLYDHDQASKSTKFVAGTFGYMAPEYCHDHTPTEKTDVYSFGAVALEIATGMRASTKFTDNSGTLVDWVWAQYRYKQLLEVADVKLDGKFDRGEMAIVLQVGLLCSHPEAASRPTMRKCLAMLKGEAPVPEIPPAKPTPTFGFSMGRSESILSTDSTTRRTDFDDISRNSQNTHASMSSDYHSSHQQTPPR